jgi:capsular exopolysaccharide synthesis family protein
MTQYDVDLRDYWRIIRKRKASILIMVLLLGLCSYGFAKLKEPTPLYEAGSAIKIDRFSNLASILTGGFWRQSENLQTHTFVITSFPVLCETARLLGRIPAEADAADIQASKAHLSVIQGLKEMLEAEYQEGTNIITIRAESPSPAEAARVANALPQAYREYNARETRKKTTETKAFIESQLRETRNQLKEAEHNLQVFRETDGLVSLDAQTRNTLDRLFTAETAYEEMVARIAEIENQLRAMAQSDGNAMPSGTVLMSAPQGSPLLGLRDRLSDLLLQRQNLLIQLTPKHPQVVEISDRIRAVVAEIENELRSMLANYRNRAAELQQKLAQLRKENLRLPEKGLQLVRLQREVELQESLYAQLKEKYQETMIQDSGKVDEIGIVKPAVIPEKPFNVPSKLMIVFTGIVMGLIVGVVFAFLAEMFDTSMGTIEDVEELLEVPVLGVIPQLDSEARGRGAETDSKDRRHDLVTHYDTKSQGAEAFRALRTNLQFLNPEQPGKLFLVTSAFVQEGKTLNIVNLALSMAQVGKKVLLIDADLRKPLVHKIFGLPREAGITDCVLGNYRWDEVVKSIPDVMLGDFGIDDILLTPGLDNLHIMTAGTKPPNPTEIVNSSRYRDFLEEVKQQYDYVFIDAPPILPVADATEIAPLTDGVFLVYTVGKIGRGVLKRAKSNLDNVDARVLGIILNRVKPEAGPEYFRYHSHYYYGGESKSGRSKLPRSGPVGGTNRRAVAGTAVMCLMVVIGLTLLSAGVFLENLQRTIPDILACCRLF